MIFVRREAQYVRNDHDSIDGVRPGATAGHAPPQTPGVAQTNMSITAHVSRHSELAPAFGPAHYYSWYGSISAASQRAFPAKPGLILAKIFEVARHWWVAHTARNPG